LQVAKTTDKNNNNMRVALTISPITPLKNTIIEWFRKTYPDHHHQQLTIFEEETEEDCNPYHAIVVYFVDYQFNAIRITNVRNLRPKVPLKEYRNLIIDNHEGVCSMDHIIQRIQWLESQPTDPLFPTDPALEHATKWTVGLLTDTFKGLERKIWLKYWADYTDDYQYYAATIEPTLEDCMDFNSRYPQDWLPTHWYSVPFEDLSEEFSWNLRIYYPGVVHITYKEYGDYQWWKYEKEMRQLRQRAKTIPMHPQLEYLITYIKPPKRAKPADSVDIEDIGKILPPCLKSDERFPGDEQRQFLVRSLKGAGVSLESVESYLNGLNDKFPHSDGNIPLKRRWDYEAHYEKGYAAPNCEKMGKLCPFQGPLDKKKMQCHKEISPDKYRAADGSRFYGPKNWIKWSFL
jgi:hypothetical protein